MPTKSTANNKFLFLKIEKLKAFFNFCLEVICTLSQRPGEYAVIEIRPAVNSDARAIATVHIDSWQATYRGFIPDAILDNFSLEKRAQEWHRHLSLGVNVWVAEVDGKVVGFSSFGPSRDDAADRNVVAEINTIYLLPEFCRKGIGRKLCQAVFNEVTKKGFKEITVWALEGNTQAVRFYESIGFTATGDIATDRMGIQNLREVRYKKVMGVE